MKCHRMQILQWHANLCVHRKFPAFSGLKYPEANLFTINKSAKRKNVNWKERKRAKKTKLHWRYIALRQRKKRFSCNFCRHTYIQTTKIPTYSTVDTAKIERYGKTVKKLSFFPIRLPLGWNEIDLKVCSGPKNRLKKEKKNEEIQWMKRGKKWWWCHFYLLHQFRSMSPNGSGCCWWKSKKK